MDKLKTEKCLPIDMSNNNSNNKNDINMVELLKRDKSYTHQELLGVTEG